LAIAQEAIGIAPARTLAIAQEAIGIAPALTLD